MRTLYFTETNQSLRKAGDFSHLVKGSDGYLKSHFDVAEDMQGYKLIAVFEIKGTQEAVTLDMNRECMIPPVITAARAFRVFLLGSTQGKVRVTTNKVLVEQE